MERILIGYDGGARGDDALALGRVLAATAPASEVAVAIVYEQLSPKSPPDDERPAQARVRRAAEARLERARARWPQLPASAWLAVCANHPSQGLQRAARERGADVIVLGASHRAALGRIWPGSVTERTLHHAPCAVAVAPPGYAERATAAPPGYAERATAAPPARVGAAVDGSPEARAAVRAAGALAAAAGAELLLVSVVDPQVAMPVAFDYDAFVRDLHAQARAELAAAARTVPAGVAVDTCVIEGRPADELAALDRGLDLLVLGSRGRGPVRRVVLGSVSAHVVRHAAVPVVVVPRGAAPAPAADASPPPSATPTPRSS